MRRLIAVMCAMSMLGLAACGGGGATTSTTTTAGKSGGGAAGPQTVKVGVLPISDVAPIYLGRQRGFFKQQGINVVPHAVQGGADVVTGVVSGDFQFGFAATEPLIVAHDKGLDLRIVTTGDQAAMTPAKAWSAIMVKGNGAIGTPADLEGKTIATNALQNMNQLAAMGELSREGVDVSKIKWSEIAFPDMPAALAGGRVDAVTAVEPFVTVIKGMKGRTIKPLFEGLDPGMTIGTYFTTPKEIAQDPDLVKRFATAMNKSLDYARTHPAQARAVLTTYTKIPPAATKKINLPLWRSNLNRPSIELMAKLAKKFGFSKSQVDVSQLIWSGATTS